MVYELWMSVCVLVGVCGSVRASYAQSPVLISSMWGNQLKIDGKSLVAIMLSSLESLNWPVYFYLLYFAIPEA